jgi:hypothetical protein
MAVEIAIQLPSPPPTPNPNELRPESVLPETGP